MQQIINDHHDAFLVTVFGVDNCGLTPERIKDLLQRGVLVEADLHPPHDPVAVTIGIADLMEYYASNMLRDDFLASLHEPLPGTLKRLQSSGKSPAEEHPSEHSPGTMLLHDQHHKHPHTEMEKPEPPDDRSLAGDHLVPPRKPPVDNQYTSFYNDAVERIGMYCRGLGDVWSDKLQDWIGEEWTGDVMETVPDMEGRQTVVHKVRQVIVEGRDKYWTKDKIANELGKATGDFGRNWRRIVETELQSLYNETVAHGAAVRYGKDARVARVPESNACKKCLELFLGDDGLPIVWDLRELLRNGNNVGKSKTEWKPVLPPVHPRCRCGTTSVSPGGYVDRRGIPYLTKPTP